MSDPHDTRSVNHLDFVDAKHSLMNACMFCAPTGTVQEGISRLVHVMEMKGATRKYVVLKLAQVLTNGLQHNEWPNVLTMDIDEEKTS